MDKNPTPAHSAGDQTPPRDPPHETDLARFTDYLRTAPTRHRWVVAATAIAILLLGMMLGAVTFGPAQSSLDELESANTAAEASASVQRDRIEELEDQVAEQGAIITDQDSVIAETDGRETELDQRESGLDSREEGLDERSAELDAREEALDSREAALDAQEQEATGSGSGSEESGGDSTYYENCDAARADGAAPVRTGDPGYGSHLDRDGDGVGCE
ncbi:excalibur calcium-binding domain-containing protein [Glycomyces tarimensis]